MNHPSALALEAFAVGEPDGAVAEHLSSCTACRAHVEALQRLPVPSETEASAWLAERTAPPPARALAGARVHRFAAVVALPLAIAAGVLLFLEPLPPRVVGSGGPASSVGGSREPVGAPFAADTTFKGGVQIAVVRDRAGAQERFSHDLTVRSGDRLRLEVALDREQVILGAVLGDDGSFIEIMDEKARATGTHLSERSVRVDREPTRGTLLVGAPDAVRRAKLTRSFDGLATLRVEVDAP